MVDQHWHVTLSYSILNRGCTCRSLFQVYYFTSVVNEVWQHRMFFSVFQIHVPHTYMFSFQNNLFSDISFTQSSPVLFHWWNISLLEPCCPIHSVWFLVSLLYNMCLSIMHKLLFYCDSCGSSFLQNIGPDLPDYKVSHPRRLLLSPYIATVGTCLNILQDVISKKTVKLLPLPLHHEISAFIIIDCMETSHWKHWPLIFTTDYKYNTTILTCKL